MQLLVFLEVLLEVEGLPAAGLRAGEGLLVDVLVLLVVLWAEKRGVKAAGLAHRKPCWLLHLSIPPALLPSTPSWGWR